MTVSNSSCLIALEAIGKLDLLPTFFGTVLIPEAVLAAAAQPIPCPTPWRQANPSAFLGAGPCTSPSRIDPLTLASPTPDRTAFHPATGGSGQVVSECGRRLNVAFVREHGHNQQAVERSQQHKVIVRGYPDFVPTAM